MNNLIVTPGYASQFSCIGAACEDSCCHDWTIIFDKKSYKNTLNHPKLASLAKEAFIETKTDANQWAKIKLNANGICPFVNEQKLCAIHAAAGETALSHTCKTYPRSDNVIATTKYESLTISCPEAARLVLFDANAFQFEAKSGGAKRPTAANPAWLEKTYDYSLDLLINMGVDWQQALMAIGLLVKVSDQVRQNTLPIAQIDQRFEQLILLAQTNQIDEQYQKIPYTPQPQTHAFVSIHDQLCKLHSRSLKPRFTSLNDAIGLLCNESNQYQIDDLNKAWEEKALPALSNYQDLFDRYILYSLYHEHFPMSDSQQPWMAFRLLVIDCFMIRCYLSAMAFKNNGLTESDIVLCFQIYSVVRQHKAKFAEGINQTLQECGIDSIPAAISLLKTS